MSLDYPVPYLPPSGTKYKWFPPPLTYKGWACPVECLRWPQSLELRVDRDERGYYGHLRFTSINDVSKTVTRETRYYKTARYALLAIEKAGDELLKGGSRPWMKEAVKMGWRPPCQRV